MHTFQKYVLSAGLLLGSFVSSSVEALIPVEDRYSLRFFLSGRNYEVEKINLEDIKFQMENITPLLEVMSQQEIHDWIDRKTR